MKLRHVIAVVVLLLPTIQPACALLLDDECSMMLKKHEGFRSRVYEDSTGHLTIGYGTNVDAGITEDEARSLLLLRIKSLRKQLALEYDFYKDLTRARQDVLVMMAYNLGLERLQLFEEMRKALEVGDYEKAAEEMLDSKWHRDVGKRARDLACQMKTGIYRYDLQECLRIWKLTGERK